MADSIGISEQLIRYIRELNGDDIPSMSLCRSYTEREFPKEAWFMVSIEEAQFLSFLVQSRPVERILEIGTFTGYSAMAFGKALRQKGEGLGHVDCLEISECYAGVATDMISHAGLSNIVKVHRTDASDWLREKCASIDFPKYDLVFIDADKPRYTSYFEWAVRLLKKGGLIVVDNVLWAGKVIDASDSSLETVAIREFNNHVQGHYKGYCFTGIGDGLLLFAGE